jgi:hypothetical protein
MKTTEFTLSPRVLTTMANDDYLDAPPLCLAPRASGPIVVPPDNDPPIGSDCDHLKGDAGSPGGAPGRDVVCGTIPSDG